MYHLYSQTLFILLFICCVNTATGQTTLPLPDSSSALEEVIISGKKEDNFAADRMNGVEQFGIYAGKKTEVISLSKLTCNTAANNPRQLYARVTGLNIWESDQAGLQLGIGGRGLNPNRTANFNTRQNGYDISADALGYPESYYTPPAEALERIEIVRGAASLQYGTQFGGLLNFRFKTGPTDKKISLTSRQTVGSWNFRSSFNSLGGTILQGKVNYYTYLSLKKGDGWRPNSGFNFKNAYAGITWSPTEKLTFGTDITFMEYLAQQPGGLTDKLFQDNARQSVRSRNWFSVQWNMAALTATYAISERSSINIRNFGLLARRQSLGNLERINVADLGGPRTLIAGAFKNIGQETRFIHRYTLRDQPQTLLLGYRIYKGYSTALQGFGPEGNGPDFTYLQPDNLENSDYQFPNTNQSIFAEQVFNINEKWSVTPGVRWERIVTRSEGYYKQRVLDGAGNIIVENKIPDQQQRQRSFVLGGIGISYKPGKMAELYANLSQNYRAINFTDLRIVNPNFVVDSNLRDERGITADLGIRSRKNKQFTYELTAFFVKYNGKIGQILRADQPPLYNDYRLRTNVSDARNIGIEAFGEIQLLPVNPRKVQASVYANLALVDARYIHTDDASIRNKQVEMAPPLLLRTGLSLGRRRVKASVQYSWTARHYSDATNSERTATAVEGVIPAYGIADCSASWQGKWLGIEASCNNLLDARYFTRRAESYPGPGIIPADGRGMYLTLTVRL